MTYVQAMLPPDLLGERRGGEVGLRWGRTEMCAGLYADVPEGQSLRLISTAAVALLLPPGLGSLLMAPLSPPCPSELVVAGGGRPPARMMPLKTYPPVEVARGAEGLLLNG